MCTSFSALTCLQIGRGSFYICQYDVQASIVTLPHVEGRVKSVFWERLNIKLTTCTLSYCYNLGMFVVERLHDFSHFKMSVGLH